MLFDFNPKKKWVKGAMGVYIYIICIYVFIYLFICLNVVRKIHKTNNTKIKWWSQFKNAKSK